MQFTQQDQMFMQLALDLAAKGQFTVDPNPSVGCVLVNDGEIVGKGVHSKGRKPKAQPLI